MTDNTCEPTDSISYFQNSSAAVLCCTVGPAVNFVVRSVVEFVADDMKDTIDETDVATVDVTLSTIVVTFAAKFPVAVFETTHASLVFHSLSHVAHGRGLKNE